MSSYTIDILSTCEVHALRRQRGSSSKYRHAIMTPCYPIKSKRDIMDVAGQYHVFICRHILQPFCCACSQFVFCTSVLTFWSIFPLSRENTERTNIVIVFQATLEFFASHCLPLHSSKLSDTSFVHKWHSCNSNSTLLKGLFKNIDGLGLLQCYLSQSICFLCSPSKIECTIEAFTRISF